MPKFFCKDYLSEALQQRRSKLEAMQVPPPHHIEYVNQYVHRGEVEELHLSPTDILESAVEYSQLPNISCTDSSITDNLTTLRRLTDPTGRLGKGVEGYETDYNNLAGEGDVSRSLLSQDIDSAMERFVPSSAEPATSADASTEQFAPAKLLTEQLQVDEGSCGDWHLEELECPLHLEGLLHLMPTVEDMVARLRPKVVQDPLLDGGGKPHSYSKLSSSDFSFTVANSESPELLTDNQPSTPLRENFSPDKLIREVTEQEVDPFLELVVEEEEAEVVIGMGSQSTEEGVVQGVIQSALGFTEDVMPGSELELEVDLKTTTSDLQSLVSQCKNTAPLSTVEATPSYTPPEQKQDHIDFAKLNQDCSSDSGIGQALLESPCIPPPPTSTLHPFLTSTPFLRHQLSQLEPLPLTPQGELCILSPVTKKKQLKEMWEKEKLFDSVLALTLPCPDVEGEIGELVTVEAAMTKLDIKPLKYDGDIELELDWDPLDQSYESMSQASKSLLSSRPVFDGSPTHLPGEDGIECREEFMPDVACEDRDAKREGRLSPIVTTPYAEEGRVGCGEGEETTLPSDVPDLCLEPAVPDGYLKLRPLPKDPPSTAGPLNHTPPSTSSAGLDPWGVVQQASARNRFREHSKQSYNFRVSPATRTKDVSPKEGVSSALDGGVFVSEGGVSALEAFLMLRRGVASDTLATGAGGRKRARLHSPETGASDKRPALSEAPDLLEENMASEKASPVFQDVCITGRYLAALSKMEGLLVSLKGQLEGCGLHLPMRGEWPREICVDFLKFFMKQQQKVLQDNPAMHSDGSDGMRNCKLAACLYVTGSVLDTFIHCSLKTAISHFSSLLEKYSYLLQEGADSLKATLLELQTDKSFPTHPKLAELVRVISCWKKETRRSNRDKVVVIVAREFSVLSGEILDYLQSIPGLESSVFSLTSCEPSNDLYKNAVEERFHHYDCLVVPLLSLSDHSCFLWEKVSLLVEYEPLKTPLFPQEAGTADLAVLQRLQLQQYVALRSVLELSASSVSFSLGSNNLSYTVVASESVTSNSQLLQLLETRYNVLVVERDYSRLTPSKWLSWADICVSQGVGILLRPLTTLASATGGSGLIHAMTGLSLQYQTCWIILYQEDQNNYEMGGCVPYQLSLLHASLSSLHAHFQAQVLLASSTPHLAHLVRRITEETHKQTQDQDGEGWDDRSWLSEEMTEKEKFLLSFPCINSFSAQFMLHRLTFAELLTADLTVLRERLPGIPERALKLFHEMCHLSALGATGSTMNHSPSIPGLPDQARQSPFSLPPSEQPGPSVESASSTFEQVRYSSEHSEPEETTLSGVNFPSVNVGGSLSTFQQEMPHSNTWSDASLSVIGGSHHKEYTDMHPATSAVSGRCSNEFCQVSDPVVPLNFILNPSSQVGGSDSVISKHRVPASSPIPGLNDSLEYLDSDDIPPFLMHSGVTESSATGNIHTPFDKELGSWVKPVANDFQFSEVENPFMKPKSTMEYRPQKSKFVFWHQRSPPKAQDLAVNYPTFAMHQSTNADLKVPHDRSIGSELANFSFDTNTAPFSNLPGFASNTSNTSSMPQPMPLSIGMSSSRLSSLDACSGTAHPYQVLMNSLASSSTLPVDGDPLSNLHSRPSEPSPLETANCRKLVVDLTRDHPSKAQSTTISSYLDSHPPSPHPPPSLPQPMAFSGSSLFDEGPLVPRSSKAICSQVVRKPRQLPSHKPVKAMELGIECDRDRSVKLRSNDRILARSSAGPGLVGVAANNSRRGADGGDRDQETVVRSKYFPAVSSAGAVAGGRGTVGGSRKGMASVGMASLKAFHQLQGAVRQREI